MNTYKKIKLKDKSTIDEHRLIKRVRGYNNVVHHIDHNKLNNNLENLTVMTRSEHAKLHGLGKTIGNHKKFAPDISGMATCKKCNRYLLWDNFIKIKNNSHGRSATCKDCRNKARRKNIAAS